MQCKALCLSLAMAAVLGAQEQAWQPLACPPGPFRLAQRFAVAEPVDTPLAQWQVRKHDQAAAVALTVEPTGGPDGTPALRLDYEFKGDRALEYVDVGPDLPVDAAQTGAAFALQVKGGVGLPLRARLVDASGEAHQFDLLREDGSGWCAAAFSLDQHTGSWGGDGNGRLDFPCRLRSILFDRPAPGYTAKGTLWIAALSHARPVARQGALLVEAIRPPFGNLFEPGAAVRLHLHSDTALVRWRWTDAWGADLGHGEGPGSGVETSLVLPASGYYACTVEAGRAGDATDALVYRCAALPPVPPGAPANDVVGFTCHFGQNLAYPLACMDLYKAYGFSRFRDEIAWRSVEVERGRYALPAHASAWTARARELGLQPLLILDYNNPHYDSDGYPNSDAAVAGFAGYAAYLAATLQGTLAEFEVWNEWVGGCGMDGRPGDHGPEAYGRLLKATHPVLKRAQPQATVVGIGGEYGPQVAETIARMVSAAGGTAMDAFSIHPYRYPRTPEESGLVAEVCRIADRAAAAGAPRRTWITEIGWPTHCTAGGVDEPTQARLLVRALALLQGSGAAERIYLYDFKNDGTKPDYNEHNFGIVLHQEFNCAPKPAAVAVAVFGRQTAGCRPLRALTGGEVYGVLYRRPAGDDLLLAWSTRPGVAAKLTGEADRQTDLMGRETAPAASLTLGPDPVYLTGRHLDLPGTEGQR